jgi:hypothetical protein
MESSRALLFPNESAGLHLPDHEKPQGSQQNQRRQVQQPARPTPAAGVPDGDSHALVAQHLDHVGIIRGNGRVERRTVILELAPYFLQVDGDLFDVPLIHIRHELREVDFLLFLACAARLDHLPEQEGREHDHQPENHGLNCRVHLKTPEKAAPCSKNATGALLK